MARQSIGTAWIQIKPSMDGISRDVRKGLENEIGGELQVVNKNIGKSAGEGFKNSFLASSKQAFSEGFAELGRRSDEAFARFSSAAKVGLAAAGVGVGYLAKQLDSATGSQKSFEANMKLAGLSSEETAKTFKGLSNYANKTIYSLSDMTATTGILASSGVKNAGKLVEAFGNLAAAGESPQQAIKSISQQMSQVNGKGFIQTMDFRIMQEQASGPMKLVQEELMKLNNWDSAQFQEALSKGEISAEMMNNAILKVGGNKILNDMATKPATIGAAWEGLTSTLIGNIATSDAWTNIQKELISVVSRATDWIDQNKDGINQWIQEIINGTKEVVKFVIENKDLILTVAKVAAGFMALMIAGGAVRAAISQISPYYKLAKGGFMAIAGGVQMASNKFDGFKKISDKITKLNPFKKHADDIKTSTDAMSIGGDKASKSAGKFSGAMGSLKTAFTKFKDALVAGANAIVEPIKVIFKGIGEAIAGFFNAFSNPALIKGIAIFTLAMAAVAASILMMGLALQVATPGFAAFLNDVMIPWGEFMRDTLIIIIQQLTDSIIRLTNEAVIPLGMFIVGAVLLGLNTLADVIIRLTNQAVIPLINAIAGGLIGAFNAATLLIRQAGDSISKVIDSISFGIERVINAIIRLMRETSAQDWYGTGFNISRNFAGGIIDGAVMFLNDGLNRIINQIRNIPVIGEALQKKGLGNIDLSGLKMGKRASGGAVFGPGGPTSDSIPMWLSNGEYVIKASTAKQIGYSNLDQLNETGSMNGGNMTNNITINGYNRDPRELAQEVSRQIALNQGRVMA